MTPSLVVFAGGQSLKEHDMAIRQNINEDVLQVLFDLYCRSIKYQREKNAIKVKMTFDEYLSLWSVTRIATITKKLAQSRKSLDYYLTNSFRPVLSWKSKEARILGGDMTVDRAAIMKAEDSKKLFQFHTGDKHTADSRKAIGDSKRGVKQSPEHVKRRTQGQVGKKRGPMTEEAKAKLRVTRAAKNAAAPGLGA